VPNWARFSSGGPRVTKWVTPVALDDRPRRSQVASKDRALGTAPLIDIAHEGKGPIRRDGLGTDCGCDFLGGWIGGRHHATSENVLPRGHVVRCSSHFGFYARWEELKREPPDPRPEQ
jgi:hypothetical protein